jgi:hypothetical protein
VAEKLALVPPAGTVTLAGTVALVLLLAREVPNPPVSAAQLNVTVHIEDPPALTVVGVHDRPVSVGETGCKIESVPPVPDAAMDVLVGSAEVKALIWIGAAVSNEPDAIVNVALAKVPLLMMFVLIPYATQIVAPMLLEQVTLLLAAVALDPAVTVTLEISEDE